MGMSGRFGADYEARLDAAKKRQAHRARLRSIEADKQKREQAFSSSPSKEEIKNTSFSRTAGIPTIASGRGPELVGEFLKDAGTAFATGMQNLGYAGLKKAGMPAHTRGNLGYEDFRRAGAELFTLGGRLAPVKDFMGNTKRETTNATWDDYVGDFLDSYGWFTGGKEAEIPAKLIYESAKPWVKPIAKPMVKWAKEGYAGILDTLDSRRFGGMLPAIGGAVKTNGNIPSGFRIGGLAAARSGLAAHQISMMEDNKQDPLDKLLEGLGPSERETLPWESAGELPKTDVVRTTRTTSISRPPKDRVDTIISSDTPITNTDFQAASLGIFKDDLEELAANGVEDSTIRKAIDQINDRTISGSKQPAKVIKENTEGYKVVWDPPAGDSTNLANVLRKRFIRLDKDGKKRFIEGRIKDGYTEAQAEKAWKGLGKVSDEELISWWTNYRKHNPDVPWEIRAIKSDKAEDLWPVVGGIDFDHVYAAASAKGSGKFSNFTPLGHYLNRLKGKMSGPEFLDYLENPDNNLNYVFELLGGRNGAYAQSIAKAK